MMDLDYSNKADFQSIGVLLRREEKKKKKRKRFLKFPGYIWFHWMQNIWTCREPSHPSSLLVPATWTQQDTDIISTSFSTIYSFKHFVYPQSTPNHLMCTMILFFILHLLAKYICYAALSPSDAQHNLR